MGKLVPVNDYFLVELQADGPWAGQKDPEEGIRKGKVVAISDFLTYWGSHTYYFDSSMMNEEILQKVHDKYKQLVGKVVWWPERSESGTIIEHEGKQYLLMKWASIMAMEED